MNMLFSLLSLATSLFVMDLTGVRMLFASTTPISQCTTSRLKCCQRAKFNSITRRKCISFRDLFGLSLSEVPRRSRYDCLEEGIDQLRRQPLELPSGRTVYLAKSASHCKWFVGAMERAECGRLLMAAGNCDYLVRLQVTGERAEYEICINDKGHLARSSIMRSRAGDFVTAQGQFFASLGELLEHARDEAVFKGESGRSL